MQYLSHRDKREVLQQEHYQLPKPGYPRHRENRENRENGPKKFPVRESTGNLEILSKRREFSLNTWKTQGILLAQVVNVLILKVKDIAIVAAKQSMFFPEAG